jgi:type II secretory pathway predicted ATPase ExeA
MSGRIKNQVLELLNGKKKNTVLVIDEASLLRLEVFAELHTLCQFGASPHREIISSCVLYLKVQLIKSLSS